MAIRASRRAAMTRFERRLSYERLEDRHLLTITTLTPVADTFTATGVSAGSAQVLDALDANGPGDRAVYLRFDLSGVDLTNIVSATLTLRKTAGSRNDTIVTDRFDVYGLTNAAGLTPQNWNEATLAEGNVGDEYTNTAGNGLDTSQLFNLNQETGADVTELVNNSVVPQQLTGPDLLAFLNARKNYNGLATFITYVDAGANRGWGYGSRENANAALRPALILDDGGPVDPPVDPYPVNPVVVPRQMERLNRGIVAAPTSATSVYIGWRLLGNDPTDIGFNLYRSTGGAAAVKLNSTPLTQTTDFVDNAANLAATNEYFVRPVIGGVEQADSESVVLAANAPIRQYLQVPIQPPPGGTVTVPAGTQTPPSGTLTYTYNANDASVGDLDGDGQYEIVLKWDPSNSQDNANEGLTGPTIFDAYRLDGTLLWRINLGRNIRAGAHYSPYLVYDFDGDGRAEVVMKTADGTVDGQGNIIGNATADFRDGYTGDSRWGRILTGPEFLTVFDGLTGAALSTIAYPLPRGSVSSWGDNYGNRVDRFLAGVAYLDGTYPSIVMTRGYYDKTMLAAYDWRNGQLTQRWLFDSTAPGNSIYEGQGNHNLSVADVDGDGKDEIIYGAMSIDDDGTGLYSTGLGHGDALHVSNFDPTNPGLEVYQVHEDPGSYGVAGGEFRDAMTGELIFGIPATDDVGRGAAGDIWAGSPGAEMWAAGGGATNALFGSAGNNIGRQPSSANFLVWWDADPVRELLDGQSSGTGAPRIDKYGLSSDTRLLTMNGALTNNGTKSNPSLSGDILGDWREEVIVRANDNLSLRIYTTITPSTMRLYTLMHDPQYREAIAWQNAGYNQPPHPSFFLGAGMQMPPAPKIFFGGELKGDYNTDGVVDSADYIIWRRSVGTADLRADGDHDGAVGQGDYAVWRSNFGNSASLLEIANSDLGLMRVPDVSDEVRHRLNSSFTAQSLVASFTIHLEPRFNLVAFGKADSSPRHNIMHLRDSRVDQTSSRLWPTQIELADQRVQFRDGTQFDGESDGSDHQPATIEDREAPEIQCTLHKRLGALLGPKL
jgi:hypothetical protein